MRDKKENPGAETPGQNTKTIDAQQDSTTPRYWTEYRDIIGANGYSPVPIPPGKKGPRSEEWPTHDYLKDRLRKSKAGVGIKTADTPAIDVDVFDDDVAEEIRTLLEDTLDGHLTYRVGAKGFLLPCRLDGHAFKKLNTGKYSNGDGVDHGVEFLATGQQFVALHIHPDTGKPYTWSDGDPSTIPHADLPALSAGQAEKLHAGVIKIFEARGWEQQGGSVGTARQADDGEAPPHNRALIAEPDSILEYLHGAGCVAKEAAPGKWNGVCAFAPHNSGDDTGAVYWQAGHEGRLVPEYYCSHDGCAGNKLPEVVALANDEGASLEAPDPDAVFTEAIARLVEALKKLNPEPSAFEVTRIPATWFTAPPPDTRFTVAGYLPRRAVSLLVAAGGVGKSLTSLYLACSVATDTAFLGCQIDGNRVAYLSLEDPLECVRGRLYATGKSFDTGGIVDNLFLIDRYGRETHVVTSEGNEVHISKVPAQIITALKAEGIDLLIADTLVRSHSVNENDNAQMSTVMVAYERIASELDCAVLLLHHVPKAAVGGGDDTSHLARGAGAITDNARSAVVLEHATEKDVQNFDNVDPRMITEQRLIKVTHRKHNYSRKEAPKWLVLNDGHIEPFDPEHDERSDEERRYCELYQWWTSTFNSQPLCKTTIVDSAGSIRPPGTSHGREKYKAAIAWAMANGHATVAEDARGDNPRATYYMLKALPVDEAKTREFFGK